MRYRTDNQILARDTSRHISLIANAGSGKTTVLVDRYIDIIQQGLAGVRNVVALTFTDKAAGELRKRIAAAIIRRREETSDPRERARLDLLREQLSSAVIGTIHSFCAQLLREYPVDVQTPEGGGIDASFTILEGVDQQTVLRDAVNEVFQKILQPVDMQPRPEIADTIRMLGRAKILQIVHRLLAKREIIDQILTQYRKPDAEIVVQWDSAVERYLSKALPPSLDEAFRTLAGNAREKHKEKIQPLLSAFLSARGGYVRLATFDSLRSYLMTDKNGPNKRVFDSEELGDNYQEQIRDIRNSASIVKPFTESVAGKDEAHGVLLRNTRILLDITAEILSAYARRKAENAQLDFDDLQLHMRSLLADPELRRRISGSFTYIMVDEFQDTNLLQYEILISLVENFTRGNLFIVGDPKQSIYGFRNADVGIFMRAIDEMNSRQSGGDASAERTSTVTLAESFRLLPSIAAFVNTVFGSCMDPSKNRFDVPYEHLVVGRMTDDAGKVELLLPPAADENRPDPGSRLFGPEEEMIARRILGLHADGYRVHDMHTDEPRPVRFGDIAILLRSRTNLDRLEQALLHYRVPYLIFSGGGFYQTQELYDFFNYFQFLLNPHDDGALAGILRSPFFACSDAALYSISRIEAGDDFWSKTRSLAADAANTDPQVVRAVRILESGLLEAGRKSLSDLITEIIGATGYAGIAAASRRAAQHRANVGKLLQLAASFESRGFSNLYDFVERLKVLIESEEREGQASIDEAENAVHVMTIHAAKGLEFNAVFVPYLHRMFKKDNEPFLGEDGTIGFTGVSPSDYDASLPDPVMEMLKQESRKKTEAEERRIYYVAFTRARDLLVLSALPLSGSGTSTMYSWMQDAMKLNTTGENSVWSAEVPLERLVVRGDAYERTAGNFRLEVAVVRSVDGFPGDALVGEAEAGAGRIIHPEIDPIVSTEKGEFFYASRIKTYHDCPLRYHLAYHLGMPEVEPEKYPDEDAEEDESESPSGTVYGTLVHAVLQRIAGSVRIEEIPALVRGALAAEGFGGRKDAELLCAGAEEAVRSFCTSEIGRRVLAAERTLTEYTLEGAFGNDYIGGTIDRLYFSSGIWGVLDYKTDVLGKIPMAVKNEMYRYQMMVYAWLVSRSMEQEDVPVTLFYTGRPAESPTWNISAKEIVYFEAELGRMIRGMRSGVFPANRAHCPYCPYARNGKCIQEVFGNSSDFA